MTVNALRLLPSRQALVLFKLSKTADRVRTMSTTAEPAFLKEKEKFLRMTDTERRKSFKGNVTAFDQIPSWEDHYKENKNKLDKLNKQTYVSTFSIKSYPVKPEFNKKVSLWKGDITNLEIDAIVNAANNSLLGGGGGECRQTINNETVKAFYTSFISNDSVLIQNGCLKPLCQFVDGAIHRGAGKFLLEECRTLKGCETGDAKITGGYNLPAKYVIHTVGPQGEKPGLLESCYKTCFQRLLENNLKSIAFPCISTGIYGYPQDSAASVALKCARNFMEENSSKVEKIVFCLFLEKDVEIYETMMQSFFPCE